MKESNSRKQIHKQIANKKSNHQKSFAVLVDPDKVNDPGELINLVHIAIENKIDYFFVGGSFIAKNNIGQVIKVLKTSAIPVVLFPGNFTQIDGNADAILFLSLISGRNPEYLISQQVLAAPVLKKTNLEIIPTGYMLINDQIKSSAAYVSSTIPIPFDKTDVACATAMAGEMLGMKLIYLDAGSGSEQPIPSRMISAVKGATDLPLIVGGGIKDELSAMNALKAGADVIVVGNGIEDSQELMIEISTAVSDFNEASHMKQASGDRL